MDTSPKLINRTKQRRTSSLEDLLLLHRLEKYQQGQKLPENCPSSQPQLAAESDAVGIRRNASSPGDGGGGSLKLSGRKCTAGGLSQAARKLGGYVDNELHAAFSANPDPENRRRCFNHVIDCLNREILKSAEVRNDLEAYRLDIKGFPQLEKAVWDAADSRRILGNLEYQVSTLRDRLLFPIHNQQLTDLSHVCGCIHFLRIRLGFVGVATQLQQKQTDEAAIKEAAAATDTLVTKKLHEKDCIP